MGGSRAWFVLIALALLVAPARADRIAVQARQVRRAGDYKLRLSAALALAKTRDARAIVALTYALRRDRESTVRRVAALSLGKQVDATTPSKVRRRAMRALETAADRDRDLRVRRNARRALKQLDRLGDVDATVYVNIGSPTDQTRRMPRSARSRMQDTVRRTIKKHLPTYATSGDGSRPPTRSELERRGMRGFFVGSSLAGLKVRRRGRRAEVACRISVRVSSWEGRDGKERLAAGKAASATGSGKVISAANRRGVSRAARDCVQAVLEEVTARQVVPFLRRLVASR